MRLLAPLLILLVCTSSALGEEQQANTFVDTEMLKRLPETERQIYVAGLADAFTYLSRKTGYLDGLNKCFAEQKVTVRKIDDLLLKIISNENYPGISPAAQGFDISQQLGCQSYLKLKSSDVEKQKPTK